MVGFTGKDITIVVHSDWQSRCSFWQAVRMLRRKVKKESEEKETCTDRLLNLCRFTWAITLLQTKIPWSLCWSFFTSRFALFFFHVLPAQCLFPFTPCFILYVTSSCVIFPSVYTSFFTFPTIVIVLIAFTCAISTLSMVQVCSLCIYTGILGILSTSKHYVRKLNNEIVFCLFVCF